MLQTSRESSRAEEFNFRADSRLVLLVHVLVFRDFRLGQEAGKSLRLRASRHVDRLHFLEWDTEARESLRQLVSSVVLLLLGETQKDGVIVFARGSVIGLDNVKHESERIACVERGNERSALDLERVI